MALRFIKLKISILTISTFVLLVGFSLFQVGLQAAEESQTRYSRFSAKKKVTADSLSSTGGLQNTVFFTAKDSVIYDLDRRTIVLCGKARIDHDSTSVKAPEILIDFNTSLLNAYGVADSTKKLKDPAVFTDRKGSFTAETMSYNFKTGKGETSNVVSSSSMIKFGGEHVTKREDGKLNIIDGTFTTCEDDKPHYWISSSNITITPGEKVVTKPLIMYVRPEIFDRRLPAIPILALPYMVFPIKEGRSSGFLTPSISRDSHRGYFLSNFGYFWAIDDYMDLKLEGDIAVNGSWRFGNRFRYAERNVFTGEISGEYKRYFLNPDNTEYRDWNAKIVHNQVFDPSMRLDARLGVQGGNRYYDLNAMNSETVVSEQSNAYASLGKTFNDESSIAALFYDRSEDLRNHNAASTFGASFYQNRIYPFRSGYSDDWRKDISITSGAALSGTFTSLGEGYAVNANVELGYHREFAQGYKALFTQGLSVQHVELAPGLQEDDLNATKVVFPLRVQSTLFNYFNLNPGLTVTHFLNNERSERDYSTYVFTVDASTKLYGILETGIFQNLFGLKALRHTFIPTITYSWNAPFTGNCYNYYNNQPNSDWTKNSTLYNRFDWNASFTGTGYLYDRTNSVLYNSRYSGFPEGQSMVGITLKNLFQGKFRDSSEAVYYGSVNGDHTVQLLSLNVSTAYNFAADAFQLVPLTITAESNALSSNFLLSTGAMYDFYSYNPENGERVNLFNSDKGHGLLRFLKGFMSMSLSVKGENQYGASSLTSESSSLVNTEPLPFRERFNRGEFFNNVDYRLPWQLRLSLYLQSDRSNPLEPSTTSLINTSAQLSLSKNWQAVLNSGFDFHSKELIFPVLQLYNDLHCWQISFQWVPMGNFRSYAIQIGLKAPQLRDIHFRQSGS